MKQASNRDIYTAVMRNPHLLTLTIIIILVGGFSALQSIPRLEDPVITSRNPLVLTLVPGASAERIEAQVTEIIEEALKEVPEIRDVDTTSRANISFVAIELAESVTRANNKEIFSRIRDKIDDAAQQFPPDALEPVFDDKRGALAFTLIAGLFWDASTEPRLAILNRQAENLADALRNVPGTDIVRVYGAPAEKIRVEVRGDEVNALGLSLPQIAAALRQADVKVPAGSLDGLDRNFLVEVDGELDSVSRVASVPLIVDTNGTVVRLGDIARVERATEENPVEIARSGERQTVLVAARVLPDQRVDLWAEAANAVYQNFADNLGEGVEAEVIFDQNTYTSERLGELAFNLLLGAGVVFLVIFFSMGWRASWIVGSALPLTAALTLFVLTLTGGKLHQMSIFGMIIALGLLIDNAIVTTDEVRKHIRAGSGSREAVSKALRHLFVPLLSSTLTTIFAFAPILLLPGNAGDFVGSIGGSVIIALGSSFAVSMVIIASLAGLFGKSGPKESRLPSWLAHGIQIPAARQHFQKWLVASFRRPLLTMGLASVIPVLGFLAASTLGVQFFPRTDRNQFEIQVWLPTATSIHETVRITQHIEAHIRGKEPVQNLHWMHGGSFPSVYYNLVMNKDNSSHYAQGIVEATDFQAVKKLIPQLQEELDIRFPEAQVVINQFAQGPPSEADVELRVIGPNIRQLQNFGETIRLKLAEHPSVLHTQVSMPRGEPKVYVKANEVETALAGLNLGALAQLLQANLQGLPGGTVIEDVEELPVEVRYADSSRRDFSDLRSVNFSTQSAPGSWIPLEALGNLEIRPSSGGITRRNGERVNTIRAYTRNEALPIEVTQSALDALEAEGFQLPPGYRLQVGGDSENQSEAVGNLTTYLPVLGILTVAILILSFRSLFVAGILGTVAFLSVGVGLLATWFAGLPLSFNTILGSLGLVGLAFNSSIVVLAAIRSEKGESQSEATTMAKHVMGSSRHLISTTLTTIGSFLPLLIFVGGDFWPPLAIVLAGGVGGSTLLAMFFTPSAYGLIQRIQNSVTKPEVLVPKA